MTRYVSLLIATLLCVSLQASAQQYWHVLTKHCSRYWTSPPQGVGPTFVPFLGQVYCDNQPKQYVSGSIMRYGGAAHIEEISSTTQVSCFFSGRYKATQPKKVYGKMICSDDKHYPQPWVASLRIVIPHH